MDLKYKGLSVIYPDWMMGEEAKKYVDNEIDCWTREYTHKVLARVVIEIDPTDSRYLLITAYPVSPVRKVERYDT